MSEEVAMELFQKRIEKHYFELVVVLQKYPQHISLVPCTPLIDPFFGILEGIKDVVKVNIYALVEDWQNLEKDVIHITARFSYMRGIDEKDIICFQLAEQTHIHILYFARQNSRSILILVFEQRYEQVRIWLDESQRDRIAKEALISI
jgi:hypothetical protein